MTLITLADLQHTIEVMLQVQRQLQESQLQSQHDIAQLQDGQRSAEVRFHRLTDLVERFIESSTVAMETQSQLLEKIYAEQQQLIAEVEELKASNRRQERLNDFLLKQAQGVKPLD